MALIFIRDGKQYTTKDAILYAHKELKKTLHPAYHDIQKELLLLGFQASDIKLTWFIKLKYKLNRFIKKILRKIGMLERYF